MSDFNEKEMTFKGWWPDDDPNDKTIPPWEEFAIVLCGQEAGDTVSEPEDVKAVLARSGLEIRQIKT